MMPSPVLIEMFDAAGAKELGRRGMQHIVAKVVEPAGTAISSAADTAFRRVRRRDDRLHGCLSSARSQFFANNALQLVQFQARTLAGRLASLFVFLRAQRK